MKLDCLIDIQIGICKKLGVLFLVAAACSAVCSLALAQDVPDLPSCIASLRSELPSHPTVRAETFDASTRGVRDLRPVIDAATQSQPEFKLAVWDYVARLADQQRVLDGRQVIALQSEALSVIAKRRGVDAATVVSVFGVETDYGHVKGKYSVIDATLSRACLNLDSQERKNHFFAALWLVQEGLVKPDEFRGSWAGAFGLTQFMPGTFIHYMDSASGSERPDIIGNPADALATTARFLAGLGWTSGLRWAVEVSAPKDVITNWNALERDHSCVARSGSSPGIDSGHSNSDALGEKCKTSRQWAALNVKPLLSVDLAAWPGTTRAALFAPAGPDGPVWLVSRNFQALWLYNRADAYALSIGLLSDALRGDPPMQARWPTDDAALGRIEFRELQSLLLLRGHADVVADGADGPKTQEAVRQEQQAFSMPESGRAGAKLLGLLRDPVNVAHAASPASAAAP